MSSIIQVSNLSKSYIISHEGGERYTALRDVVSKKAKGIFGARNKTETTREEFWALKDINFEVEEGDRVGIIGRNGAGKSTLLKVLSRITEPTTGNIRIKGRVASLLEVGTGFHPELTGRENIFLNGAILGMSQAEIKRKFDEIVDFSGVEKFLDTPVKRYSSGMYVRLAFAVAAHLEPEILVVDEVLAVGDADFQKKCLGKMEDVSKNEGRTVLFVSHNIGMIQKLCNRGILLHKGNIVAADTIDKVVNEYVEGGSSMTPEYYFDYPSNQPGLQAYTTKLTISGINNEPLSEIPIGKPWKVTVDFTVRESIKGLVVGLGMVNSFETPIRTCWNLPRDLAPGNYRAGFEEDNIVFTPGRYRLLVGLSIGNITIQYLDKDMFMHISDAVEHQDNSVIQNTNGVLLNQMKMYVEQV